MRKKSENTTPVESGRIRQGYPSVTVLADLPPLPDGEYVCEGGVLRRPLSSRETMFLLGLAGGLVIALAFLGEAPIDG